MPQIAEIAETEKQRGTIEQCRTARLYREGGFLRAYEWSAWLFVKFVSDFKVSNRKIKNVPHPVAMIGFPPTSLTKFSPEGSVAQPQDDGSIILMFPPSVIPDQSDPILLAAEYDEWKAALPVSEKKEKQPSQEQGASLVEEVAPHGINTLTSIMQRIIAYPIESKSPMESIAFLSEIKRQLSALI